MRMVHAAVLLCVTKCRFIFRSILGNQFFFSKNRFSLIGSVNKGPISAVNLVIEENLVRNLGDFRFGHYIHQYYRYRYFHHLRFYYYPTIELSLFQSFLKIEFSNEQVSHNQVLMIDVLTSVNNTSCSDENQTYFYFPIKFFPVNVTGSVSISLHAYMISLIGARHYANAYVDSLNVDNGENRIV